MKRRPYAYTLLALLCAALAVPSAGWAASGGSGLSGPSSGSPGSATGTTAGTTPVPTATPALQSGDATVSTSGGGITLQTRASAILRKTMTFTGSVPSGAGKTIEIQRSGHETDWTWANTVHTTVASDGSFTATWTANHIGRFAMRAVIVSANSASSASVTPSLTTTVYRPSRASWYGPGMYGSRTACGTKLTKNTIGVANKTLPCGMQVAIYYHGQTLTVPVIDHGPYVAGRDWDLTAATARALGIDGVALIGAVSLPTQ
ncbi:MAG TPA: septal ring lytic transglycosylase RlpA family protein [Solirubrobacteraceae bacterium]|nr:septal ring lytic transglycosylase RlpA family protein [Solirubrobacteraceae bacterium]